MWQQIDGFAPLTFGEDVDFCRRLLATKARAVYLPRGVVYHDYRTKLWAFMGIRASYASAEAALLQRHPEERRVLVLPPEQATFAVLAIGGLWLTMMGFFNTILAPMIRRSGRPRPCIVGAGEDVDAGKGPLWPPVVGINQPKRTLVGFLGKWCGSRRGEGGWDGSGGPLWSPAGGAAEIPSRRATSLTLPAPLMFLL